MAQNTEKAGERTSGFIDPGGAGKLYRDISCIGFLTKNLRGAG